MKTWIGCAMLSLFASVAGAAEPKLLTTGDAGVSAVTLSPDGAWAVFAQRRGAQMGSDVCVANLASGEIRNLTARLPKPPDSDQFPQPQVTPDGKSVLYNDHQDLWSVPLAGGEPVQVTRDEQVTGFLVHPKWNVVLFTSQRSFGVRELKGKAPKGAAAYLIGKLFKIDLAKNNEVSRFTNDVVSDTDTMALTPDGLIVSISEYPDSDGRFSDRKVTLLDAKGKRKALHAAVFGFPPAFLGNGTTLLMLDQVIGKDNRFTYPVLQLRAKDGKKLAPLPVTLPEGHDVTNLWTAPDGKSVILGEGSPKTGVRLWRWQEGQKEMTRLCEKELRSLEGGAVTPDGKKLVFMAGEDGMAYGQLGVLDL